GHCGFAEVKLCTNRRFGLADADAIDVEQEGERAHKQQHAEAAFGGRRVELSEPGRGWLGDRGWRLVGIGHTSTAHYFCRPKGTVLFWHSMIIDVHSHAWRYPDHFTDDFQQQARRARAGVEVDLTVRFEDYQR